MLRFFRNFCLNMLIVVMLIKRKVYIKFKPKYQQIGPVFPDYLSVSYDYGARNLDEYFH